MPDAPGIVRELVARYPVTHWPGSFWHDLESGRRAQATARVPLSLATPWSGADATALMLGVSFFFLDPLDRVADLLNTSVQAQTGRFQRGTPIIGQ